MKNKVIFKWMAIRKAISGLLPVVDKAQLFNTLVSSQKVVFLFFIRLQSINCSLKKLCVCVENQALFKSALKIRWEFRTSFYHSDSIRTQKILELKKYQISKVIRTQKVLKLKIYQITKVIRTYIYIYMKLTHLLGLQ